ncbi:MAG TPA: zinc-ribbon domain-containing protein [Myxococcaceae bacterium]
MDVRCERCKTLYELDDARVSEAGTTVRCTTCGHVFRVRKKVLLMTEAVGEGGESTAVPPPVVDKPAWRVRSPSGRVIAFRELTSMQKWIVERKFGRDDEISLHGDHWKRLGDIAELQPFFLLLDEVDRVHQLEERLRRAEAPDEAPEALERELGGEESPETAPTAVRPALTPIRLETPIEPPAGDESDGGPGVPASWPEPRSAGPVSWPTRSDPLPPEAAPAGVPESWAARTEPAPPPAAPVEPEPAAETSRPGPPSAFSLEDIREATRPSPDDPAMPEGTVEPPPPQAPDEADQPQFTRRAGLGVSPGAVEDLEGWDTPPRRSHTGWLAAFLSVVALGLAGAAYFELWVPAQEEKLRQEAQRARLEETQKARDAEDAEVRERERKAKEELVAGMANRPDAGTGAAATPAAPVDAGTGGSAAPEGPRGSAEPPPPAAAPTKTVAAVTPPPRPGPAKSRAPEPRARSFDEWMAQGDRDRAQSRAKAALDAYGRASALDGSRPEAYLGQGRAHLELGDPRSAIAAFRRALMVNSRYTVAEFWLGEAYRKVGQSSQAVEAYGRYLEAAPEGAEAPRAREALNALR